MLRGLICLSLSQLVCCNEFTRKGVQNLVPKHGDCDENILLKIYNLLDNKIISSECFLLDKLDVNRFTITKMLVFKFLKSSEK